MYSLTRENIQNFCRACLRSLAAKTQKEFRENDPTIYHIKNTNNLKKWMAIVNPLENGIQHHQFSQYVCSSCYENFKHVNEFKEMVEHSYSVMTKLLTSQVEGEPEHKEDVTLGELLIKSEPMDNDYWEMNNSMIKNNVDDYDVDESNGHFGIDVKVELSEGENVLMDHVDTEFMEPLSSPPLENEEGQPKATKSFKCSICNLSYIHKYTYVAHIRQMHLGIERAFECETCHKKYTKFCNLYRHMRLEHNQSLRQYKCEYKNCNRSFRQLSTRRKHYEIFHNYELLENSVQEVSQVCFKLGKAQNVKHSVVDQPVSSFGTQGHEIELRNKATIPFSNKRLYICPICSTNFETSYDLKVHMNNAHIDDLKFACHICGKHKISQMKLDEHIATVHENPKVKCSVCEKVLKSKSHLRQHILSVHNGIKPFACEYCPSTFAAKNTLKVHTRIHTGEKPFKCRVCERRFRQLTPMKKHLETHERGRRNEVTEQDFN